MRAAAVFRRAFLPTTLPSQAAKSGSVIAHLLAGIFGFALASSPGRAQQQATPAETSRWLQTLVEEAAKAGNPSVTIPPGTYRLGPLNKAFHLRWEGIRDLTIEAAGVEFVFTEPTCGGFEFSGCSKIALRGARLRHDPLPFTQGRLEKISEDRQMVQVRIDAGYPANLDDKSRFQAKGRLWFYLFEGTSKRWRPATHDVTVKEARKLEEGLFEMTLPEPLYPAAQAGDGVAFRGRSGTDIRLAGCAGMRIEDVEIANGGGFCVHEAEGDGGNFYRYRVTYGPPPAAGSAPPLIACNADAFHSSNVRKGPTLENCSFEGMPDDGVPIHGIYARLLTVDGGKAIVNRLLEGRPGDRIRILDAHARIIAETTLLSYADAKDFKAPEKLDERNIGPFFAIELKDPLPKGAYLISNIDACGSGFVVRDCTIRNHRARGMLIKSGDGLIENNLIEGSTKGGIVLAPEYHWREACYSWNIIIRNNVLRKVGTAWQPNEPMAGAISVGAFEKGAYADNLGHRNILIESNAIEDTAAPNLVVSSAKDITIKKNRFVRPQPSRGGRHAQLEGGDNLIVIAASEKVSLKDNVVIQPSSGLQPPWIKTAQVRDSEIMEPALPDGL